VTWKGAVRLSDDLERYLAALGLPHVALLVSLRIRWPGLVGPLLAEQTVPARLRGGVLTISVRNHAWAQELQLCKPALLAKVAEGTGPNSPVHDLRFVVGAVPVPADDAIVPAGETPRPPSFEPEGLSTVADPEIRETLRAISGNLRPKSE
jgi:predicted nucleic acid-binding Zn ribbon protein